MKLILNFPILASLLFIFLFEYLLQYNMFFMFYLALIYVTLKTTGVTYRLKVFMRKTYDKLIKQLKGHPKNIDLIYRNSMGQIEGRFYVKSKGTSYLVESIRDRTFKNVVIKVHNLETKKMKRVETKDFYMTRDTVIRKAKELNLI